MGRQKGLPTSFFLLTSTNSANPKLLNLNQAHLSKKKDFSGQTIIKLLLS